MTENIPTLEIKEFTDNFIKEMSFSKPIPELYHYTTTQGINGIISNKCLWLTESSYFNDRQEIIYGLEQFQIGFLTKALELSGQDDAMKNTVFAPLNRRCSDENISDNKSIFMISFCENGDLLSQWKGYTAFGKGYSISIDPNQIEPISKYIIGKVIYNHEEHDKIINQVIQAIMNDKDKINNYGIQKYLDLVFSYIQLISSFFKNDYFIEENEWRLMRYFKKNKNDSIQLRTTDNGLVPYIILRFQNLDFIKKIIIGPKLGFSRNRKALSYFIDSDKIAKSIINVQ